MLDRLFSFFQSKNKRVQLTYFYYERKAGLERWVNGKLGSHSLFSGSREGKVNLSGQTTRLYGMHRSGWNYAMNALAPLHNPRGILVDGFVDHTFSPARRAFKGYSIPWIGFIHVPPGVPSWKHSQQSNEVIFQSPAWKASLAHCRGLFALSRYHRDALQPLFDFRVENLLHPVEFPELTWSYERFLANPDKQIVHAGWWLRRIYSFYLLPAGEYGKTILLKEDAGMEKHLKEEYDHMDNRHLLDRKALESVTRIPFLPNEKYDRMLAENILFLDLIDASANNAIIECIARNTPVLVNPLPAVMEYLGPGYPFYFHSLDEAASKAANHELVRETARYLKNLPVREQLTAAYFQRSFVDSEIYRAL